GRRPVFATLLVYDFQSQESCGLRHNTRKTQGFSTKNCDIQRRGFLTLNNHATYTRTVVIRYVKIRSAVNPYDPKWEPYLEARMGWQLTQTLAGRSRIEYLWKEQQGRCMVCGQPLRIAEEDCQIHHRIWRSRGGSDRADNLELMHANCHRQIHVQERRTEATAPRKGRS